MSRFSRTITTHRARGVAFALLQGATTRVRLRVLGRASRRRDSQSQSTFSHWVVCTITARRTADIHSETAMSGRSTSFVTTSPCRDWRALGKRVRRQWILLMPCSPLRLRTGACAFFAFFSYSRVLTFGGVCLKRPDTTTCLMHPYFWDPGRRLGFLQDASDRFEIMCRDPRDPHLVLLENNAINVVGPDWPSRLDKIFVENLGKFRKYDGRSVQDLLRALRNKVKSVAL